MAHSGSKSRIPATKGIKEMDIVAVPTWRLTELTSAASAIARIASRPLPRSVDTAVGVVAAAQATATTAATATQATYVLSNLLREGVAVSVT
jgi:hypothetical protein